MNQNFAITGTVTYAIKGRDVLRRHGYKAQLKRTVNSIEGAGCGYGVITNCKADIIEVIFNKYGIKLLKIVEHGVED